MVKGLLGSPPFMLDASLLVVVLHKKILELSVERHEVGLVAASN